MKQYLLMIILLKGSIFGATRERSDSDRIAQIIKRLDKLEARVAKLDKSQDGRKIKEYVCTVQSIYGSSIHIGKATTELEAEAHAWNACLEMNKGCETQSCQPVYE